VHEMLPYRSLPEHIEEQLRHGRTVLVEMDAWYLPTPLPPATAPSISRRQSSPRPSTAPPSGSATCTTPASTSSPARTTGGASTCSPTSPTTSWTRSPSLCASAPSPG
jgi:hypothetical protein